MKFGLTIGLILASFVFALSMCLFCFGCSFIFIGTNENIWLAIVIGMFAFSIISMRFIVKCKVELDRYVQLGKPVYLAAEHVKKIIERVNIYGVENLQGFVEKIMKEEVLKISQKKGKRGK